MIVNNILYNGLLNKLFDKPLYKLIFLITKTEKYKKFDIKKEADLEILKD